MKQEKRAWVYCRIDAPEDTHGALKNQRKLLMDYGWKRAAKAVQEGNIDVLVVQNISRIGRDTCRIMEYLEKLRQSGIDVYSPMEGKLSFSLQRFIGMCMGGKDLSP